MNEAKATVYQRLRRRGTAWAWVSAFGMLTLIAVTPMSSWLEHWAVGAVAAWQSPAGPFATLILFTLSVVALWELAVLPATLHVALGADRTYLAAQESRWASLGAELQAVIVGAPFALYAALGVQGSIALFGPWWWLSASAFLALGVVGAMRLLPVVLGLVGTVRPLARKSLVTALAAVVDNARVPVAGVYEWGVGRGARASALVAGIGRTRRVLLAAELARSWTDEEVAVVVAHELAHYAHHDLLRAAILDTVILAAGLWAADAALTAVGPALGIGPRGELSALPAIGLVAGLVWFCLTPLRRAQSRRHERRADVFALECTGHAEAFGAAVRRLGAERLAEERPTRLTRWLFHRHPTVAERLALAEAFMRERQVRGSN